MHPLAGRAAPAGSRSEQLAAVLQGIARVGLLV